LIRWIHPQWGRLSPAEFILIAEETGLIFPLTNWVVKTVVELLKVRKECGMPPVPISINVGAQQFISHDFVRYVREILQESRMEGKWLEVEITETSILDNHGLVEFTIEELKRDGIKVSLDDFGTGYSSLHYLAKFQVDTLKIDRSFIQDIESNRSHATIVETVIHLAHGLGLNVVAEGVETCEQLTVLKDLNCDEAQGYLFSKPVTVDEFLALLIC
jgi:EAL domain-containing protein (putative c-di-GMP-specific phosphodiesterase class I)